MRVSFTAEFTADLPDTSFQQFLSIADHYLTQGITWIPKLHWSDRWKRWIAYIDIDSWPYHHYYTSAHRVARRIPPMSSRIAMNHLDLPPRLNHVREQLFSFVGENAAGPVIPWQRAAIALLYHDGISVSKIAQYFVVSEPFIVAILRDFNEYQFAAFNASFKNGVEEIVPSELYSEIVHIARSHPSVYGMVDGP